MIRLVQSFGVHTGRRFELTREVITIGRLPESDIAFDPEGDRDASGRHAEIRASEGRYVLVDMGSRNGTYVDGRSVARVELRGGEELEFGLGGPRLRVEALG